MLSATTNSLQAHEQLDFPFEIIKSKRKTLGLYVKDKGIEVRAPYWVRDQEIHQFLIEKSDWCREKLTEHNLRLAEVPDFSHESQCLFFGTPRTILHHIGKPQVIERGDILHVFHYQSKSKETQKHREYMSKWLRKEAERYLYERTSELEQQLKPPKPVMDIQFRKTKSKWGHCTSKGEIQLNWLLIMAPPDVMDYVIIHEICHLTHMNHSKDFWLLVKQYCNNYKLHQKWLLDKGHLLSA